MKNIMLSWLLLTGIYSSSVNADILDDKSRNSLSNLKWWKELFLWNIMAQEIYKSKVIKVLTYKSNIKFIEKWLSQMVDISNKSVNSINNTFEEASELLDWNISKNDIRNASNYLCLYRWVNEIFSLANDAYNQVLEKEWTSHVLKNDNIVIKNTSHVKFNNGDEVINEDIITLPQLHKIQFPLMVKEILENDELKSKLDKLCKKK